MCCAPLCVNSSWKQTLKQKNVCLIWSVSFQGPCSDAQQSILNLGLSFAKGSKEQRGVITSPRCVSVIMDLRDNHADADDQLLIFCGNGIHVSQTTYTDYEVKVKVKVWVQGPRSRKEGEGKRKEEGQWRSSYHHKLSLHFHPDRLLKSFHSLPLGPGIWEQSGKGIEGSKELLE